MRMNRILTIKSPSAALPIVLPNCRVFLDFDNTITTSDVLDDIIQRFSINDHWTVLEKAWQEEQIGTKECLEGQLRNVRVTKKELFDFLKTVEIDPYFYRLLILLNKEGIPPVVLSDNFSCIVKHILECHGIKDVKVYANTLRFHHQRLTPSFPYDNPFCPSCAHCKKIHLTGEKQEDKLIVYVGDGRSDLCPARVADVVFAKGSLLQCLRKEDKECILYKNLKDVYHYFEEMSHHGRQNCSNT